MKKLFSKRNIIIFVALVVLGIGGYFANDFAMRVEVDLHTVDVGKVVESFNEDGYIEAVKTAEVQAAISGNVDELFVEIGDEILKDDVLLLFDDDVLNFQIEGVEAEIKALDYQLLEASKPADQERINNANIAVAQARSNRDKLKKDYEDNLALYSSGNLSKVALDASEKLYNDSVKAYSMAINESKLINKGISENLTSQYEASIDALYAQRKILERQLEDYTVDSPMSGVVLASHVKSGNYVMVGQALFDIDDLNELKLVCEILEDDYSTITIETPVILLDTNTDESFEAMISKIYPRSESAISDLGIKQNRVKIEVKPKGNLDGYIVGQSLELEFITKEETSLRVPIDAVYKSKGKYYVFVVENGMIASKKIEVGIEGEDYYTLLSGLSENDEIVKVITNDLEEGLKIK